jgi:carbon-monoxide dehydrogenase small subunit
MSIKLTVNGIAVDEAVEPRLLLVDFIRDRLKLKGVHIGCEDGVCGACTILVNGQAVKSCLMFAIQADGATITTIEGLAPVGQLHPIQRAFQKHHGLQCGYCTPAMVLSTSALLARVPRPSDDQIRQWISGNVCRCTGYNNIVKAVRAAANETQAGLETAAGGKAS